MTSPEDARAAIELILAIYESSATGKPVKLPLKKVQPLTTWDCLIGEVSGDDILLPQIIR